MTTTESTTTTTAVDSIDGSLLSSSSSPAAANLVPFQLDIHAWVESQQTSHGVRHDDYAQYHAYCTRRLARISHNPSDVRPYLVHSSKYGTITSSSSSSSSNQNNKSKIGRHAFCSRSKDTFAPVQSNNNDDDSINNKKKYDVPHINILWYLLVSAERCWAQANEIQKANRTNRSSDNNSGNGAGGNGNGNTGGKRQRVLKKLKRANEWATLLLEMAHDCTNKSTHYECEAYSAWMTANLALEKMKYQEASDEYARAMTLCYNLSALQDDEVAADVVLDPSALSTTGVMKDGTTDQASARFLQRQDLFVTRADTLLRPLFRYCQYELKRAGLPTMEEPRLNEGSQSTQSMTTTTHGETIVFRGHELVLDNKELRVLLLKLQSMEQDDTVGGSRSVPGAGNKVGERDDSGQPEQHNREAQFLTALSVLDDALEVIQSLQRGLASVSSSSGPAVQAKLQQYSLWKGYLQYCKTRKVMEHMEGLLEKDGGIMGHAERVHIFDALLQHAKSLLNLPRPGQENSADATDLEEDEFGLQVQANILRLRARKTYHMGWVYYQPPLNKHTNALALMEHSAELCKRAQEEIAACDEDMPHGDEYLKEMEELPVKSAMGAIQAAMMLQQRKQAQKLLAVGAIAGGNSAVGAALQEPLATDRPLLLRLYEYDCGIPEAPIADLRPMPLPCKPVFYDLAYDYAMDPSRGVDRIDAFVRQHTVSPLDEFEEGKDGEVGSTSGSIFGWLTGGRK